MFQYPPTTFDVDKELDKIIARDSNSICKFVKNTADICVSRFDKIIKSIELKI